VTGDLAYPADFFGETQQQLDVEIFDIMVIG
jgi:hypothetical protein